MLIYAAQQRGWLADSPGTLSVLVILLSVTAFVLWRRYQSRRKLVERIAELETLSVAGRAIVATEMDTGATCALIGQEVAQIVEAQLLRIGLFEGRWFHVMYSSQGGQELPLPAPLNLAEGGGLVGWVGEHKQSLLIRDFEKEKNALPAEPRLSGQESMASAVYLPLVSGSQAIGAIVVQSSRPDAFSTRDLGRLTILANQGAAAIANARMYERVRQRASHLELVGQIAQRINAINDLDEVLQQLVSLTQRTFGFRSVNVFLVEPRSGEASVQASSIESLLPGDLRLAPGQGLVGTALATKTTALASDTSEDGRYVGDELSADTRSEIVIPLIVEQQILGVLDVQSEQQDAFSNQEQTVLEALAAQAAIAIYKARQFEVQREQAWATTAQLQVADAISREASLESLAQSLARLTPMLVGGDQCAILLWSEEVDAYQGAAAFGVPDEIDVHFEEITLPLGIWTALDAVHVGQEALVTRQTPPWLEQTAAGDDQAYVILPLIAKAQNTGVMVVQGLNDLDESLSDSRGELLRSIAAQAAQAVDSIQLQLAQQEEAWVNTALLQVAEAVNKLTDVNEILNTIVRMIPMLVGVESCVILIWNEDEQSYRGGPSFGLSELGEGILASFEVDLSEFPLLETQDVERVGPDAAYYTFRLPRWMGDIMNSKTADVFPLYARARLVGALLVGPTANRRPLTGRRLNIVSGIAQQAAIALVNDQLYKESAERNRMEQELSVARSIQASLIPSGAPDIPGCTVSSFWQAARQVSGDFYDFLHLSDDNWGIAIADVADKGVPAALFMALSRTILRTVAFNRLNPAEVLERTNQLIYGDSSSDLFVTVFYAIWNRRLETLTFANGGHNPPVLIRHDGSTSLLEADGIALGVLDRVSIAQRKVRLQPGDSIVLYTDGVTEAMNEDYDEFGMERLCLAASSARSGQAGDILAAVTSAIEDHVGGTPQFDDITLVILKRR